MNVESIYHDVETRNHDVESMYHERHDNAS